MAVKLGMTPEYVEEHAKTLSGHTDSLEALATEVSRAGWASRSPSLFDLIPGASLVMTAGSILLAESAAADVRAAIASSNELLNRLRGEVTTQRFTSSDSDGSYVLGFMNAADAKAKFDEIMKDPGVLEEMTPQQTAAFWRLLSKDQSDDLLETYPRVIGNKSGVPLDVRVNANRLVAKEDFENKDWTSEDQKEYLEAMIDGDIQLVVFDPDNHRFVEAMNLAVWNSDTERFDARTTPVTEVVTYVPGTFSTDEGIYNGDSRAVGAWLADYHPESVVFIYKDGVFPGGLNGKADMLTGINQANDPELARQLGQTLANFDNDISLDGRFSGAEQTAIGHSWGLANITSSEVAGAHYDNVISLAGAWVPEEWAADANTNYSHHSYVDWLSIAQDTGQVGGGRNPDVTPAFSNHQYQGPNDAGVGYNPIEIVNVVMDNHDLVASTRTNEDGEIENLPVLVNIESEIFG